MQQIPYLHYRSLPSYKNFNRIGIDAQSITPNDTSVVYINIFILEEEGNKTRQREDIFFVFDNVQETSSVNDTVGYMSIF